VLGLVSEFVTPRQIMDAYQRGSGKPMPTIPGVIAWMLMRLNKKTQQMWAQDSWSLRCMHCAD